MIKYDQQRMSELQEEISIIESYLKLENIRLGNILNINIHLEEQSLCVKIPPLILQPIIENAIIHGLKAKLESPRIIISTRVINENLLITVDDNGKGIPQTQLLQITNGQSKSVGLQNISTRLKLYYNSKLEIHSKEGEGTSVTIKIPIQ